jgi:hypothetical protein
MPGFAAGDAFKWVLEIGTKVNAFASWLLLEQFVYKLTH